MHDSMLKKLEQLQNRINEIQDLLLDSKTIEDIEKYTLLNKEFSELKPIVEKFDEYNNVLKSIKDANEIIESGDDDLKVLAEDDLKNYQDIPEKLEQELKFMLLPKDSADDGSAYLEIDLELAVTKLVSLQVIYSECIQGCQKDRVGIWKLLI